MSKRLDIAWGVDTGTQELPRTYIGTPLPECDTAWLMDLRPAPSDSAPTAARPPKRVRRAARRAYTALIGIGFASIAALAIDPGALVDLASIGH